MVGRWDEFGGAKMCKTCAIIKEGWEHRTSLINVGQDHNMLYHDGPRHLEDALLPPSKMARVRQHLKEQKRTDRPTETVPWECSRSSKFFRQNLFIEEKTQLKYRATIHLSYPPPPLSLSFRHFPTNVYISYFTRATVLESCNCLFSVYWFKMIK